jgi:hypothetical protein
MTRKVAVLQLVLLCGTLLLSACRSSSSASLPAEQTASVQPATKPPAPREEEQRFAQRRQPEKPSPVERSIVVPSGTAIQVRLNSSLDTSRSRPGERFTAVLATPIVVEGRTVVPAGANVEGVVRSSASSGRFKGRAYLSLALNSIEVNGSSVPLLTDSAGSSSGGHKKRNLTLIGGGSGLGALVGGLAGGGRGALIGAGAGAAAGTAGAAFTGKKQVHLPAESVLTFHLREALHLPG